MPRKPTHTSTRLFNLYLSSGIWVINDLNAEFPLNHLSINGYTAIVNDQVSQVERNLRNRACLRSLPHLTCTCGTVWIPVYDAMT